MPMPIDQKKSTLPEGQIVALAEKHHVDVDRADDLAAQLEVWMLNPTLEGAEDGKFEMLLARHRDNAQHHTAALIWFVQAAKAQKLGLYAAVDIYIALINTGSV